MRTAKILLVESNQSAAINLQQQLESVGYQVVAIAVSHTEAAWYVQQSTEAIDIILVNNCRDKSYLSIKNRCAKALINLTDLPSLEIIDLCVAVEVAMHEHKLAVEFQNQEIAYKQLIERSLQGIAIFQAGRICFANSAFAQSLGYQSVGLTAMNFSKLLRLVHPEDRGVLWSRVQHCLAGEEIIANYEFRVVHKNGKIKWLEAFINLIDYQNCPAVQFASIDITERKTAQFALSESEAKFRALTEKASDIIVALDEDGNFNYVSPSATRVLGYTPLEVIGRSAFEFVHPEDVPAIATTLAKSLEHPNEPQPRIEYRVIDRDNCWHDFEAVTTNLLSEPSVRGVVVNCRDITERKTVEAELHKSNATTRALLETIPDLMVRMDGKGLYRDFIQARDFHTVIVQEQWIGKSIYEILPQQVADERMFYVHQALETGKTQSYEFELTSADGTKYYQEARIAVISDNEVLVIIRDITARQTALQERNQAEEALRTSQKELQQAYERINSHIENSPLGFIEWDGDFCVQRWSQKAEQIFGWTAEEVLGKHPNDWLFVYEQDRDFVGARITNLMAGIEPHNVVLNRNFTKAGEIIYCDWYNSVLFDDEGNFVSVVSLIQDVTSKIKAEEALQMMAIELEMRVEERTADLTETNQQLSQEIAERSRIENELYLHLEKMANLYSIVFDLNQAETIEEIYIVALEGIKLTLGADRTAILVLNQANELLFEIVDGLSDKFQRGVEAVFKSFQEPSSDVELLADLTTSDFLPEPLATLLSTEGIQAVGCFRLHYKALDIGKIAIYYNQPHEFTTEKVQLAKTIATYISTAISRKRTELSLQNSEEQFRRIFDEAPIGMALVNSSNCVMKSNQKLSQMLGFAVEELVGNSCLNLTHPDDGMTNIWQNIASSQQLDSSSFQTEKRYIKKDGSSIWVNLTSSLLFERAGQSLYGLMMIQDISEQKRAEAERQEAETALRQSEELYRLTFENAAIGIGHTTLEGHYIKVNHRYAEILGYEPTELLSLSFADITHPGDLEVDLPYHVQLITGEIDRFSLEKRYIRKDGSIVWANLIVSLVRDVSGLPLYTIGVIEDIGARKAAEIALRESEEVYRLTFENAAVGVVHNDLQGRFLKVNPKYAEIVGYTLEELEQISFVEVTHPDDVATDVQQTLAVIAGEIDSFTLEKRLIRKNGSIVWVNLFLSLVRDQQQHPLYTVAVVEDISERKATQQKLFELQERLQFLLSSSPAAIFTSKVDGGYSTTYVSDNISNLVGYTPQEFLSDPNFWGDRVHPEDLPRILQESSTKAIRGKFTNEYRFLCKDGEYRWVHSELNIVKDQDGQPKELIGYFADISDRKAVELALRESEERYRLAFENTAVGINHADLEGRFLKVNAKFCEITGYTASELLQKTFPDISHPDDLHIGATERELLAAGQIEGFSIEKRYIRKDHTVVWAQLVISIVRDSTANSVYTIAVVEDITERRQAEETLRLREQAIAASNNGIVIADARIPDLPIIYANPAFENMTGYSTSEVLGLNCRFLQGTDRDQPEIEKLRVAIQNGENCAVTLRNYRKDGTEFWVKLNISPIYDLQGNLTHFVGINNDITDRIIAEAELRRALEREKELAELRSQFISMVSHEFRTPLSSILLSADLLEHSGLSLPPDKLAQRFKRIREGIKRMTQLLEDVLLIGKIEAGKLEFKPLATDITQFCQELAEEVQVSFGTTHSIALTIKYAASFVTEPAACWYYKQVDLLENRNYSNSDNPIPLIYVDEKLLRHILVNLLSNAIKYSKQGQNVELKLTYTAVSQQDRTGTVYIEVIDRGIGIAEEDLQLLFENFHRGKNVGNIPGTGLGLAIVKNAAELHGGTIAVSSTLNVGTKFTVTIPVSASL